MDTVLKLWQHQEQSIKTQPCQLHVNAKWTPILFANLPFNDIWKLSNKIIYSRTLSLLYCSTYGPKISIPAYKPAFRPGLFAFRAFVTKHNSLARETAYLLSPKKKAFPKLTKKNFPLRGIPIGKPFLAILRFKNHLRLLQTFEQTIEQPQEGTFPFAAIFVYLHYRAVRRLKTRKPINQSDKSLLC